MIGHAAIKPRGDFFHTHHIGQERHQLMRARGKCFRFAAIMRVIIK